MEELSNLINGELVPPITGKFQENFDPSRGKAYSKVPVSSDKDVAKAVYAADAASDLWKTTPATERAALLNKLADLIEANLDELALAESIDTGKPLSLAKSVDIPRSAANFRFFASLIQHFANDAYSSYTTFDFEIRVPLGVVVCISPWNLPLYLLTWKIAPALAAGNCVVAKPSEVTPMTAYLLSKLSIEAGLPPGVLNILHGPGSEVGEALTTHPLVKAISFTGSTETGRKIAVAAAPYFKKLSLEMGGKNPTIIFADANYNKMLDTTIRSAFSNQGEICFCGERIYIERSLYEIFKSDFVKRVQELTVGDPRAPNTKIGAIVSEAHFNKILAYFQLAKDEGGTVLIGGEPLKLGGDLTDGYYVSPTVVEGLSHTCRVNQEEVFGPIVTLTPFDTEEEVIKLANSTKYGLSAVIWTENLSRAHRLANEIEAGIIWINCWMSRDLNTAFGGMKESGLGREGGFHALKFFTEAKNITIKLQDEFRFSYQI